MFLNFVLSMFLLFVPADREKVGWSTWYGNGEFHGTITATGEPFRPLDWGCASRSLPLNSIVIIQSLKTGDLAFCRVNDRGPYGAILKDGIWAIMYRKAGIWYTRSKEGIVESHEQKPGVHRGIMDLSLGTARMLYRTHERPPNGKIRIFYWRSKRK